MNSIELFGKTNKLKLMNLWLMLLQYGIPKSNYDLNDIKIKSKLQGIYDFKKIRSCIDLIEDTEEAIIEFFIYQLNTISVSSRLGEKYLRLYGILNAIYLQKQGVIELAELVKCPDKKSMEEKFKNLNVMDLRHTVGAHTVNYIPTALTKFQAKEGTKNSFRITQMDLRSNGSNITLVDAFGQYENINLKKEVIEYTVEAENILIDVTEKYINTLFKNVQSKKEELCGLLKLIKDKPIRYECFDERIH